MNNNFSDFDLDNKIDISELTEEPVYIDMDNINREAADNSIILCNNLEKIYGNEVFMREHPDYKKRLDIEIENLRVLIKMKMSDEQVHDTAVKAIAANPSNASMYASLIKVQSSILDIQKRMDDVVKNINTLLKGYQTELNFDDNDSPVENNFNDGIVRGSRAFICEMNSQQDEKTNEAI